MHFRRLQRAQRWILPLAAVLLLVAQLGTATHPLHLTSTQTDATCSFCVGGTHLGSAPQIPTITAPLSYVVADALAPVVDVCEPRPLVTPRSSRGPPLI